MTPLNFSLASYKHPTLPISAQRIVNAYAEQQPRGSKVPVSVHGMPGLETFATVGRGPHRGFFQQNGIFYTVSRNELYSMTETQALTGASTLLGTGIAGLDVVSIDGNGEEVAVVNGTQGFIYDEISGVFAEISDGDFNPAATVTAMDGYFIFDWRGTNKFFVSKLLDGMTYAALDFASAESKPDRLLAVKNVSGVLRLFGEKTIESWDSIGAGTPPFQRFDGATISTRGIGAPKAIAEEDEAAFIFGNDRVFYRLSGTSLSRISNHAIEKEWEKYTTVTDAFCFSVPFGGHKFVYLTFPAEGKTWGFDIATGLPHERISWDSTGVEAKWRANCCIQAFGKTLIGDANSGKIGFLSADAQTEFGDPVRFVTVSPNLSDPGGRMLSIGMLEIELEVGVGVTTGQGSDPQVMLDWSDDGGNTWETPQLWRSMGKMGARRTRLQWDRLGSFYQRIFRLQITDPVRRTLIAARAAIEIDE